MTVIDVHTHMLTPAWIDLLAEHGQGKYEVKDTRAGERSIHLWGAPFMTLKDAMWDYDLRIANMDKAGVDLAIVSLTAPNVYWGEEDISVQAAQIVNDSMAEQQRLRPDRIAWLTSLPWLYPQAALFELERTLGLGAAGVMVLANIDGRNLTDAAFAPIWKLIDDKALPVLLHPTAPQGIREQHMDEYGLVPPVGFTFDTTLAVSRMILDGFFDRYPNLKLIASHGGGTLPYLAGRLDRCHAMIPACAEVITEKPSAYLRHIFYDSVVYNRGALDLCIEVAGSADHVLYGSDYPHNIGDMAGCLARVDALPDTMARQIRGANAQRVFKL